MNQINDFIGLLRDDPVIPYDIPLSEIETVKTVKHTVGGFTLEFLLHYEASISHYIAATHENPEECEFQFHLYKHSEIALYKGAVFIELNCLELHIIDCIIGDQIY